MKLSDIRPTHPHASFKVICLFVTRKRLRVLIDYIGYTCVFFFHLSFYCVFLFLFSVLYLEYDFIIIIIIIIHVPVITIGYITKGYTSEDI